MRVVERFTVYVVAFSMGYAVTEASDLELEVTRITPAKNSSNDMWARPAAAQAEVSNSCNSCFAPLPAWQSVPAPGVSGSPAWGHPHFHLPMHHYTSWYRPRAATLTRHERCEQYSYRPRGLAQLFARPRDGYRMEYGPHELCDHRSIYGPAYIARQPDRRCEEQCDHSASSNGHH